MIIHYHIYYAPRLPTVNLENKTIKESKLSKKCICKDVL